jgi:hypothetical protein
MATLDDLNELALALPETENVPHRDGRLDYQVRGKTFVRHREERKDAVDATTGERLTDVLMFGTADLETKAMLLESQPDVYFTTDHFDGWPAVLVRIPNLAKLSRDDLDDVVVESWLASAPKRLAKAWLAEQQA